MKRAIAVLLCAVLSACTVNAERQESTGQKIGDQTGTDAYALIQPQDMESMISMGDLSWDPSDPLQVAGYSSNIITGTITSIDGGSAVNEITGDKVYPYTYGKLTVDEVLKGDLTAGESIVYTRAGGIITWDEYLATEPEAAREKSVQLAGKNPPQYMKITWGDDVDLSVGTQYLIYLNEKYTTIDGAYGIIGFQGGLREITPEKKVLNNYTGEQEALSAIEFE